MTNNNNITLSYVLTTYNKLPYLKVVLQNLIENCQSDEEIVVTDGASTDGTVEYLLDLFEQGKIHQFVSEKDFGEAHGYNKGMLMAKGELIKLITDDDVFDTQVIKECKEYMFTHEHIDMVIANIGSTQIIPNGIYHQKLILAKSYEVWFQQWTEKKTPNCFFCGLSMLIRKKSLSKLGFFDVSFKHVDLEYSVRITTYNANIAFYKKIMVCAIMNPSSISQNLGHVHAKELERISAYYNYEYTVGAIKNQEKEKKKSFLSKVLLKLNIIKDNTKKQQEYYPDYNYSLLEYEEKLQFGELHTYLSNCIKEYNHNIDVKHGLFISNV